MIFLQGVGGRGGGREGYVLDSLFSSGGVMGCLHTHTRITD